jgi:hypothetical protein
MYVYGDAGKRRSVDGNTRQACQHTTLWKGFNTNNINHEPCRYTDDITLWKGFNPTGVNKNSS